VGVQGETKGKMQDQRSKQVSHKGKHENGKHKTSPQEVSCKSAEREREKENQWPGNGFEEVEKRERLQGRCSSLITHLTLI